MQTSVQFYPQEHISINFELFIHKNAIELVFFIVQRGTVITRSVVFFFFFFKNTHGRAMGCLCECKPWLMFCLAHCSGVYIVVLYFVPRFSDTLLYVYSLNCYCSNLSKALTQDQFCLRVYPIHPPAHTRISDVCRFQLELYAAKEIKQYIGVAMLFCLLEYHYIISQFTCDRIIAFDNIIAPNIRNYHWVVQLNSSKRFYSTECLSMMA